MDWIDTINEFGEANAGAFNIISGLGGAASIIGFFSELEFRENIENSLTEIKTYLGRIEQNTITIIHQNELILNKLDELPTRLEVSIMLRQAVDEGFLKNSYAALHAAQNDIQDYWNSSSPNWISFRNSLQFAFDHDNLVSSTAQLLAHCSFAMLITKGQANQFIFNIINKRKKRLQNLQNAMKSLTTRTLLRLRNEYLGNADYISVHNMDDNLVDLTQIDFTLQPNKYQWIDGPCLVRVTRNGFCAEPGPPRRILDTKFSKQKEEHKISTDNLIKETNDLNNELGELTELLERIENILKTLNASYIE